MTIRAFVLVLCAGLTGAPLAGKADEVYIRCGPSSAGFIQVGRQVTCMGGSSTWRQETGTANSLQGSAGRPITRDEAREIVLQHVKRTDELVAADCGNSPESRDYGISPWGPKNVLGQTIYNAELAKWRACSDRIMSTKFQAEKAKMEREVESAFRRAGIVR